MANARNTPAKKVAEATQQILQTAADTLWRHADDDLFGRGALARLSGDLEVSPTVARNIAGALEFIGLLERSPKRGLGAYYRLKRCTAEQPPVVSLYAARKLLREYGTAAALPMAV